MTPELILYGTAACHLCDEALAYVHPIAQTMGVALREIDITGDDALEARYGLRIPVIAYNDLELGWPFDAVQIAAFLSPHKD